MTEPTDPDEPPTSPKVMAAMIRQFNADQTGGPTFVVAHDPEQNRYNVAFLNTTWPDGVPPEGITRAAVYSGPRPAVEGFVEIVCAGCGRKAQVPPDTIPEGKLAFCRPECVQAWSQS